MYWELWDVASRSRIADFASEAEALQAVREILVANSPGLIDDLTLVAMYDDGESRSADLPPALDGKALMARLAEPAPETSAEAARRVHKKIRKWLAEEGWQVRDVDDSQSSFNVMVTLQGGPNVNLFQLKDHMDHITLSQRWLYDDEFRLAVRQLPADVLKDTVWNIYRDISMMGVEFHGLDTPSTEMTLRAYVYFDALTKDTLVQRILLTFRSLALAVRTLVRALEVHDRPAEPAIRLLPAVSPADGPLAAAS